MDAEFTLSRPLGWLLSLLVAALTFAAVAPTLAWPQFTGGNENLVTETALEMRRGGPWLVPEMLGEPRIAKPPLTAWITALAMRDETLRGLDSTDADTRERAYRNLAWQVRWTGLLAGCLLILATHALGAVLGGPALGAGGAVIVASTILFQKFARQSTTDIHLALWVVLANVCFAHAVLHGRVWRGVAGGAGAVAIAFLCKGPVALAQTVLPAAAFALMYRPGPREAGVASTMVPSRVTAGGDARMKTAFLVGSAIFAIIALPWFAYVMTRVPGAGARWWVEVRREGATDLAASSPLHYLLLIPYATPWMAFLIVGLLAAWPPQWTAVLRGKFPGWRAVLTTSNPIHCATLSLFLPLLVMTLFRDRKDRYLLPFLAPLAVVAATALLTHLRAARGERRLLAAIHWLTLLGIAAVAAVLGASTALVTTEGGPWFTLEVAAWAGAAGVMIVICGALLARTRRWPLPVATLLLMLGLQALVMYGYARSPSGRSALKPLADQIVAAFPDAEVYDYVTGTGRFTRRIDEDVAIYLNRTVRRRAPHDIPAGPRRVVLISRQRINEPDPAPPPGWMSFAKIREKENIWWAYTRLGNTSASESLAPTHASSP